MSINTCYASRIYSRPKLEHFLKGFFFFFLPPSNPPFNSIRLLSAVNLNDFVLIDVFEDVRRVHEDADRSGGCDDEEDVKLQSIDDHRDVFPIFASLERKRKSISSPNHFERLSALT